MRTDIYLEMPECRFQRLFAYVQQSSLAILLMLDDVNHPECFTYLELLLSAENHHLSTHIAGYDEASTGRAFHRCIFLELVIETELCPYAILNFEEIATY